MQSVAIEQSMGRGWALAGQSGLCALLLTIMVVAGTNLAQAGPSRVYASPQEAVKALLAAAKADDAAELVNIIGPEGKDLIMSGDDVADKAARAALVKAYQARHSLVSYVADEQAGAPKRLFLEIGKNDWPFPIPLVADKSGQGWFFDGQEGVEELINRRIGNNELAAIEACQAYVDAQYDYYRLNPEKTALPHFAAKIVSSQGQRDGLYWESKPDEPASPLGALVADAADDGYAPASEGEARAFHGYRYRVLTSQGPHAPQGAYSYVGNDLMFGGFALLAYPAKYGVSGIMSFMVNQDGVVYEKNLGQDTTRLASEITSFDPDQTWTKIDEP